MKLGISSLKRVVATAAFGAALLGAAGATAFAQGGQYDPYYAGQSGDHRRQEKRAEKQHQKQEKQGLKSHQRQERDYYGNNGATRDHQKQERRDLKNSQRIERGNLKQHQRNN